MGKGEKQATSSSIIELLGETLVGSDGEVATAKALDGKYVGLYFSGHWCGPCRGFTPKLAESYNTIAKEDKKPFEIVFVSSDRDQEAFDEYRKEQPWLALPYPNRKAKAELSKKYKVSGIPSFVILDPDGNTVTTDGRSAISSDPKGLKFPWTPPTVREALGDTLLGKDGEIATSTALEGKYVGLYFSGHWCGPCRGFTPKLAETYNTMKKAGKQLELIFVSSDRDEEAFDSYRSEQPWLALPYANRDGKAALSSRFDVSGIPSLVILDPDLNVVTTDGRAAVSKDTDGADFPAGWYPKPLNDLSDGPGDINEKPSVILLMEKVGDERQSKLRSILETFANADAKAAKESKAEMQMCYFTACEGGGIVEQIRGMTNVGDADPAKAQLVLMDIPDDGAYYVCEVENVDTQEDVTAFLDAYKANTLTRKQLQ